MYLIGWLGKLLKFNIYLFLEMLEYPSFLKEKWNIGKVPEGMILHGWLHGLISDLE